MSRPSFKWQKTSWLVSKGTVCCEPNVVPFRILALCITNLVLLCKLLNFAWFRHLMLVNQLQWEGSQRQADQMIPKVQKWPKLFGSYFFFNPTHPRQRFVPLCMCVRVCVSVCARMRMRDGWRVGDPSVTGMRNVQNLKALKWKDVKSKPETHVIARQQFGKDCRDPSFVSSRYTVESSMSSTTSASAFIYFLPRYKQLVWDTYPGSLPNLTDLATFLDRLFPSFSILVLPLLETWALSWHLPTILKPNRSVTTPLSCELSSNSLSLQTALGETAKKSFPSVFHNISE